MKDLGAEAGDQASRELSAGDDGGRFILRLRAQVSDKLENVACCDIC